MQKKIFLLYVLACILWPLDSQSAWLKQQQDIMGTQIVVNIWYQNKNSANSCSQKVFAEMKRIDALMSPYRSGSELAKVNQLASKQPVGISKELFRLIKQSIDVSEKSEGAFDITFASVGYLYDYRNRQKPSDQFIANKLAAINFRNIKLNENDYSISFTRQGVRIDLGGIAKGYAVDNAIEILKQCGVQHGLVSAGGDSRILGDRNGRPWVMGVRHPRNKNEVVLKLPLTNAAISTSGDYERFFIEDGHRYHHIIKPQTGKPVTETWSATVIGDQAWLTDALSTTLFVLGVKPALKLIDQYENMEAIIIDAKGKMHYSSGLIDPEKNNTEK